MSAIRKTITVTKAQDAWLKEQIAAGRYMNDSEIVRDLIREASEREDIKAIRAALEEGEQSGISDETPRTIRQGVKEARRRVWPHGL